MPNNLHDYREHAERCRRLAATVYDAKTRAALVQMAEEYTERAMLAESGAAPAN